MTPTRWSSAIDILRRRLQRQEEEQQAVAEQLGDSKAPSSEAECEPPARADSWSDGSAEEPGGHA